MALSSIRGNWVPPPYILSENTRQLRQQLTVGRLTLGVGLLSRLITLLVTAAAAPVRHLLLLPEMLGPLELSAVLAMRYTRHEPFWHEMLTSQESHELCASAPNFPDGIPSSLLLKAMKR
jgi:hypothetical protein